MVNQEITLPILKDKQVSLFIKREDHLHPFISGNKYRKLKYNLLEAKKRQAATILTFGGAYSNHIAATAYAGYENGFNTVGVIRGEEIADVWQKNPTLKFANAHGMEFKFVSREVYRNKQDELFLNELQSQFKSCYILPEGGANMLAVEGCEEILTMSDACFDTVCCAVGTGGTISGIINSSQKHQNILGFPAVKGSFLTEDIRSFVSSNNWSLQTDYHFGGYAKINLELINFINDFYEQTKIPLDPIYTAKMIYGLLDLVKNNYFQPYAKILAVHTGGLQGVAGMNAMLLKKKMPLININN